MTEITKTGKMVRIPITEVLTQNERGCPNYCALMISLKAAAYLITPYVHRRVHWRSERDKLLTHTHTHTHTHPHTHIHTHTPTHTHTPSS